MIQAICWVLIHSLWQGLLFTIATGLVMLYTKRLAAATRYILLSGLFFLFLGVCICTFFWELRMGVTGVHPGWKEGVEGLSGYCSEHASLIVLGWFIVVLAKCMRMIAGVVYTQRMRHYGVVEAPVFWKEKIRGLCEELGIRKTVVLFESGVARMPMVVGHFKPVIFIPLGLLTGLPQNEVEAVVIHELAHIRRHDYFVNFLQHIAESLFFFNPALLWISSLLREERENCCDDIAIGHTNNKVALIRALVSFKEHALQRAELSLHFPSGGHQLLRRVLRITENKNNTLNSGERFFFFGSCLVLLAILVSVHPPDLPAGGRSYTREKQLAVSLKGHESVISTKGTLPVQSAGDEMVPVDQKVAVDREVAVTRLNVHQRVLPKRMEKADIGVRSEPVQPAGDQKVLTGDQKAPTAADQEQAVRDKKQAELDMLQAQRDREQSVGDQVQAIRDQEQAVKDQDQGRRDQVQALRDQAQAIHDHEQAEKERQWLEKQKKQAEADMLKIRQESTAKASKE